MTTSQDIAAAAGVSRSLVSKVLSGRMGNSSVRPAVEASIRAAAKRLGYEPNANARALRVGRQNVVGFYFRRLSGQPGSGVLDSALSGATHALAGTGMRALLFFYDEPEELVPLLDEASAASMDGALVFGDERPCAPEALRALRARGVAVATQFDGPVCDDVPNAGIDQRAVGRLAAEHLLERGRRRIACIRSGARSPRFAGYREALAAAGVPFDALLVCPAHSFTARAVGRFVAGLAATPRGFDALVAESDVQAAAALRALYETGLRVPRDIALTGVDNSAVAAGCAVPLTSVGLRVRSRAEWAIHAILAQIAGEPAPASRLFQPRLVARESTDSKPPRKK